MKTIVKFSLLTALFYSALQNANAQSWSLTGNAALSTSFIGTTNAVNLTFRTNNSTRMVLTSTGSLGIGTTAPSTALQVVGTVTATAFSGSGASLSTLNATNISSGTLADARLSTNVGLKNGTNTFSGSNSFSLGLKIQGLTLGKGNGSIATNTAFGDSTLYSNTTGANNTAIGKASLKFNSTGNYNTACGSRTLKNNTSGSDNSAFGDGVLTVNTTGQANTALGSIAMNFNTTGAYNTAIGAASLKLNTIGSNNTAAGYSSLLNNSTGNKNTAFGFGSLTGNSTASENTAMGAHSLEFTTIGVQNTAVGAFAMQINTTGKHNAAHGSYALHANTSGIENTACGYQALHINTTGSYNTACGRLALYSNTTGNYNTAIGWGANVSTAALSNATAIGNDALVNASNRVRLGNTSVSSIGGQVNWTAFSDGRIKTNIVENVPGLEFIQLLRPVTYNFDIKKQNALLGLKDTTNWDGKYDIEKIQFSGFIAQEVEEAATKIGYNFSGIDKDNKLMGLRYSEFVMPLVKSVQELAQKNEELNNQNASLMHRIDEQQKELNELKQMVQNIDQSLAQCCNAVSSSGEKSTTNETAPSLEQNLPNPFSQTTEIRYYIPFYSTKALITVHALDGNEMLNLAINEKGAGKVMISANTLAPGIYVYTLIVDGKAIDSKQMIATR